MLSRKTNAEIVRDLPKLKAFRSELQRTKNQVKLLEQQLEAARKQCEQQQAEVDTLAAVTEIYEGVALCCSDDNAWTHDQVKAVGCEIQRSAELYQAASSRKPNAAESPHWGLKFYSRSPDSYAPLKEEWQGLGWSRKDALRLAKRWAALGERPSEEYAAMCRARHKADPKGTAPRQRRDAFEAAWIAGHRELALQILTARTKTTKRQRAQPSP